jgi:GT2 family glycosyltransferase
LRSLSVIIPSKTARNFLQCAEAVRRYEPTARLVLVNDGIPDVEALLRPELQPCSSVPGIQPFCFSRNVNLGIRAVPEDDILLLNDDALLQTPGGFTLLQETAEAHPELGVIASTTNSVGNRNQYRKAIGLREDPRQVCFIAVLIPRLTIDLVGELDEDYTCYSHQDDDYCYRVRRAGLKIGIHDACFVDHLTLPSTFRRPGGPGGELETGARIFRQKWGDCSL